MYVYFNPNPQRNQVGDCVIRAISKVTGKSWNEVYRGVVLEGLKMSDMPSSNSVWSAYLRHQGFKRYVIPDTCPDCYTIEDFTYDNPEGTYLLATGTHAVAVQDGDYYDTWNSGSEIPIYYWRKE